MRLFCALFGKNSVFYLHYRDNRQTMRTTSGIFQFAVFILTLQAIFNCHGVNAKRGDNNKGSPDDTTTSGFLNPQWSELWGGIVQSHDDSRSNLKISRSKRKAWNFGSGSLHGTGASDPKYDTPEEHLPVSAGYIPCCG